MKLVINGKPMCIHIYCMDLDLLDNFCITYFSWFILPGFLENK